MELKFSTDFLTVISFAIGIIGFLIAIWQIISARNARRMYREKCETRCKDLVETIGQLKQAVNQACRIKDENLDDLMRGSCEPSQAIRPLRQLSDQIHSIYVSNNQLVRFCERLNDEHFEEFGQRVFDDIRKEFVDSPSIQSGGANAVATTVSPSHADSQPRVESTRAT
jgi:hypothetical protein